MNRREFAYSGLLTAIAVGAGFTIKANAKTNTYLRPPRSVDEFDKLCVKCGQCVQVCPYHSIDLLDINSGLDIGTAYIDSRKRGCYLCDLFPCVLACPSGALNPDSLEKKDANMGVVIVTKHESCLSLKGKKLTTQNTNFLISKKTSNQREENVVNSVKESVGKVCDLCVKLCPIGNSAIEFKDNLPMIKYGCVGCGVCVEVCPVNIIEVVSNKSYSQIYKD